MDTIPNLIRLGCKLHPEQVFSISVCKNGACALAALHSGHQYKRDGRTITALSKDPVYQDAHPLNVALKSVTVKEGNLPAETWEAIGHDPPINMHFALLLLNDIAMWSREYIAAWWESEGFPERVDPLLPSNGPLIRS